MVKMRISGNTISYRLIIANSNNKNERLFVINTQNFRSLSIKINFVARIFSNIDDTSI